MTAKNTSFLDECQRHLEFKAAKTLWGKRLRRHVIRNAYVMDQEFCAALCFMEHNCASYNLMTISENEKHNCELNNAAREEHDEDLEEKPKLCVLWSKNKSKLQEILNDLRSLSFTECSLNFRLYKIQAHLQLLFTRFSEESRLL